MDDPSPEAMALTETLGTTKIVHWLRQEAQGPIISGGLVVSPTAGGKPARGALSRQITPGGRFLVACKPHFTQNDISHPKSAHRATNAILAVTCQDCIATAEFQADVNTPDELKIKPAGDKGTSGGPVQREAAGIPSAPKT